MKINFFELNNPNSLIGRNTEILEILESRDKRQLLQQECLKKHSCSLLCISLVSPGPVKNNILLEYIFYRAIEVIESFINNSDIVVNEKIIINNDIDLYCIYSVDTDALKLKKSMVAIEKSLPIGRLWDLDVLDEKANIISRTEINQNSPRKCLICNNNAKICSRKREHSIEEIYKKMQSLAVTDCLAKNISEIANESLLRELSLTPKPGLVDKNNTGSHRDMDYNTFIKSVKAIKPFFFDFILNGVNDDFKNPKEIFNNARIIGLKAEKSMLLTTNGVNTHKGSIFSFGLVLSAIGYLHRCNIHINNENISKFIIDATTSLIDELNNFNKKKETAGIKLYRKYKLTGARGEAVNGYKTVIEVSLPTYVQLNELEEEHRLYITLLKLVSVNDDTNIANRGGIKELKWIKDYASNLLDNPIIYIDKDFLIKELYIFDKLCIDKNISPGGSADLLALTYFFFRVKKLFN